MGHRVSKGVAGSMIARKNLALALVMMFIATLSRSARGEDSNWLTDFDTAKQKAKTEKKLLLVEFTGTDWCPWCIRLRNEVFKEPSFQADAGKQFVLVELDFPHEKELPKELKAQNEGLAKQYKITAYPTVLVLDSKWQVIAKTGYRPGGPDKYVEFLASVPKLHEGVVKMQAELGKATGRDRAERLDRLIEATNELGTPAETEEAWCKEIVALDPKNEAGLKTKYEFRVLITEANDQLMALKCVECRKAIEKALAISGLTPQQKHKAYFLLGISYCSRGFLLHEKYDVPACLAALKKAIDADPKGEYAEAIKKMMAGIEESAKEEEAKPQKAAPSAEGSH
jgi:thioredoxin-related protein